MGKNNRAISIEHILATPVLFGKDSKYIWTGVVNSSNIDELLIGSDNKEEFRRLVRQYENAIHNFRRNNNSEENKRSQYYNPTLQKEIKNISILGNEIKRFLSNDELDTNLFWFYLLKDYEEILKNNPNELNLLDNTAKRELKEFAEYIYSSPTLVGERFDGDRDRFVTYPFLTDHMIERMKCRESTDEFVKAINLFYKDGDVDKPQMSAEEGIETVRMLSSGLSVSDLLYFFKDTEIGMSAIDTIYKNYLLDTNLYEQFGQRDPEEINNDEFLKAKNETIEKVNNLSNEELVKTANATYNNMSNDLHSRYVADAIVDNASFIDVGKFLLMSSVRPLMGFEGLRLEEHTSSQKYDPDAETSLDVTEAEPSSSDKNDSNYGKDLIQMEFDLNTFKNKMKSTKSMIDTLLKSGMVAKRAKFPKGFGVAEEHSLSELKKYMSKYCGDIYLTEAIERPLFFEAYVRKDQGISDWSDELIQRVNLDKGNLFSLSFSNLDNLVRLYNAHKIDDSYLDELVAYSRKDDLEQLILKSTGLSKENIEKAKDMTNNARNLIDYIYEKDIIDENKLCEYYLNGTIKFEEFDRLKDIKYKDNGTEFDKKISEYFSTRKMLEKYRDLAQSKIQLRNLELKDNKSEQDTELVETKKKQINELTEDKDKFLKMFKNYTYNSNGSELLENYYLDLEIEDDELLQESIKSFYEDRLVNLADIVTLDNKYVMPMVDKLTLEDSRKMRENMTFDETTDLLDEIFESDEYTEEQKYVIMMNLLCMKTDDDRDAIKYYRSQLSISNEEKRSYNKTGKHREKGNGQTYNKHVYPDDVKWDLFRILDKDATISRYSNGYVEINSSKIPYRIIEKYYDKNGDYAYGTATYFVEDQVYNSNIGDLITNTKTGDVLETAVLREIVPRGKDRIPHITRGNAESKEGLSKSAWMRKIAERFGYTFDRKSQYYDENLEKKIAELSKQSIVVEHDFD